MNDATVISKISKEDKRKLKINLKREGKSISGFIRVKIIEKNEEDEINQIKLYETKRLSKKNNKKHLIKQRIYN